jgi:dienelactone hydrolase
MPPSAAAPWAWSATAWGADMPYAPPAHFPTASRPRPFFTPVPSHLLAARIRARLYLGIAGIDPTFDQGQRERLENALTSAGVDYTLEVYEGARHGFAVTGHLVYDEHSSERHWANLLRLFEDTLQEG